MKMTADEKAYKKFYDQIEANNPAPNKAQHSPRDFFSLSTPTLDDKAYSHHEYTDIDVRDLTRGQLIESYADMKAHAGKLAEALQGLFRAFVPSRDKCETGQQIMAFDNARKALAAYEEEKQ
jgi:hypothetical protein